MGSIAVRYDQSKADLVRQIGLSIGLEGFRDKLGKWREETDGAKVIMM